jgi:hypothetical protein
MTSGALALPILEYECLPMSLQRSKVLCTFFALLSLPALAQPAEGPPQAKQFRAVKVDQAPVIDGVLDDAVWQLAEPISDFHQTRPGNQTPPSETTEVYVVYTEDALYVGARMGDSEPDLIAAPTIRHGLGLGPDDRLVLILDPFNTQRTGYRFETNLNAVRHDALYTSVSSFQADWSTIWDVASSRDEHGWIAEIEIPFKSLPFDPNVDTWGFNFGRGIRRRNEEMAWVSYNRTYNPSISGLMTGMQGMSQGVGLDVVPSFSLTQQERFDPTTNRMIEQPSLDVFYRLTPSLNAALTINTDFSATEVDNRQVNLTRFNLFFPERRDFFLNDSDLFQFGSIGGNGNNASSRPAVENARPYFSRRIGLSATGAPVDIEYGGRISGRVGRWNIGTLAVRQGEFGAIDSTDLFISRISANVLQESNVGFILTSGDPGSDLDNTVFGADFRYLNTRLPGGQVVEGDVWYQQSDTPGLKGEDAAFGLGLRSPNNTGLRGGIGYKEVQRNFNPALGYINRSNVADWMADVGFTHFFEPGGFLQSAYTGIDMQRIELLDGGLQSEVVHFSLLDLSARTRDNFSLAYTSNREVVRNRFTLYNEPGRSVGVAPGDYSFNEISARIGTANQRRYSGSLSFTSGDFYGGQRDNVGVGFSFVQSRFFVMQASYNLNKISLPEGDFTTRLASLTTQVAFSNTWFWVNLVQYDNVSEEIGINTRLQWIPKAGQEGFIVLNYNLQDRDKNGVFHAAASDLTLKFKYTFRY